MLSRTFRSHKRVVGESVTMRIFDVPKGYRGAGRAMRVAVHGSCRVHDPFEALATAGTIIRVWANYLSTSFTLGEVHQMMQHCLGNSDISQPLLPFIFHDPDQLVPWTSAQRRILDDVDVFIIEVSDLRQVRYRNTYFQLQNFIRNFLSRHGSALSQWYRSFSTGAPISDDLVEKALSEMPNLPASDRGLFESILRETRLEPVDVEGAKQIIEKIRFNPAAHWIFVSHFIVPGLSGRLMQDRLKLRETLREATQACDAGFFDPSDPVAKFGKEVALAKGGADIYHYDKAFESTIADALLEQFYSGLPQATAAARSSSFFASNIAFQAVASALNALLVTFHRERLAQSTIDDSGLHAHYASLLERNQIIHSQEINVVDVILRYLPEFDDYHVLRAGLGEIAFLLSAFGLKCMAVDPFDTRFSAIEAGASYLQRCGVLKEDSWRAMKGTVPDIDRQGCVLAVATQLAVTVPPDEEEEILKRLEAYDAILFSPALLVRPRNESTEQEVLLDRFRRAGFTQIRDYPRFNLVYCAREQVVGAMASTQPQRAAVAA